MTGQISTETVVSSDDIAEMAKILRKKYGENAVEVADIMISDHTASADRKRATAWAAVSKYLCQDEGFSINLQ